MSRALNGMFACNKNKYLHVYIDCVALSAEISFSVKKEKDRHSEKSIKLM